MKKIYVHIGLEKTGTSAIQYFLKLNRYQLKVQGDIYIPQYRTKDTTYTHHRLAKSFFANQNIAKKHRSYSNFELDQLLQLLKSTKSSSIIVSSELFSYYKLEQIKQFRAYLKAFKVYIILFLRRQDEYLEAQYAQHLKGIWTKGGTPVKPDQFTAHNLNYNQFIGQWEKGGFDDIAVEIYSTGEDKNQIYHQFFKNINASLLKNDWIMFPDSIKNPSLSPFHLELLKNYVHLIEDDDIRKKISFLLFHHNNEEAGIKGSFIQNKQIFTNEFKRELLAKYEASNKQVLNRYPQIGYNAQHLFQPLQESDDANDLIINELSQEEMIKRFMEILQFAFEEGLISK